MFKPLSSLSNDVCPKNGYVLLSEGWWRSTPILRCSHSKVVRQSRRAQRQLLMSFRVFVTRPLKTCTFCLLLKKLMPFLLLFLWWLLSWFLISLFLLWPHNRPLSAMWPLLGPLSGVPSFLQPPRFFSLKNLGVRCYQDQQTCRPHERAQNSIQCTYEEG